MKIALCLHGLFSSQFDSTSNGYDGYNYIKSEILDIVDTDVFIHSWDVNLRDDILKLYNPKVITIEPQIDFTNIIRDRSLDTLKNTPRPPFNILSHFYGISKVMNSMYGSDTKYDIVIKSRFDLGRINRNTSGPNLGNPYPVQCINLQTNIEGDKIYMADWNHFHMGPADMWFYGSMSVMNDFTTIYDDLLDQFKINSDFHRFAEKIENNSGDLSNSIAFYKYWMIKNGLWDRKVLLKTKWR